MEAIARPYRQLNLMKNVSLRSKTPLASEDDQKQTHKDGYNRLIAK